MSPGFFDLLKDQRPLLQDAEAKTHEMLRSTQEMFRLAVASLREESYAPVRQKLRFMDLQINQGEQEVRQKVFQYLSIAQSKDLLSGLRLLTIVIDLERIGDYTKNMSELESIFPGRLEPGEHEAVLDEVLDRTMRLFRQTQGVLQSGE